MDSAINFSGSADLHTPIHPPPQKASGTRVTAPVQNREKQQWMTILSSGRKCSLSPRLTEIKQILLSRINLNDVVCFVFISLPLGARLTNNVHLRVC